MAPPFETVGRKYSDDAAALVAAILASHTQMN
jgi:hypothetical protein